MLAPDIAVPLAAGPLRVVFDRGELRWIRLGEREILRGIYAAVREPGWGTVLGRLEDLLVEAEPESFRVRFVCRHRRGPVAFDWKGRLEGTPDGRIVFEMEGEARASFLRNRIGLCVLHPVAECAGRPCAVETVSGQRRQHQFPRLVAPHQPFLEVRAIRHEVVEGIEAEVRLEGDIFETEDQRNWSDASFKTYSTPLALPIPVEVRAGTRVRQTVTVELHGHGEDPVPPTTALPGVLPPKRERIEPVVVRVDPSRARPRPVLGLGGAASSILGERPIERVRGLRLDHARAELHLESPGWEAALERAVRNARGAEIPLELALFLPEAPAAALWALAERARVLKPRVASWLLYRAADVTTADGDAAMARDVLTGIDPTALFGGGTDDHFAALNRRRPSAKGLDRLVFSLTPQVHAIDDATVVENLESLRSMVETVRDFAAGAAVGVSPVTLRPRAHPGPVLSPVPEEPPFLDDPRQATGFAAAWTLGLVAAAAEAGVASLTLFEPIGPRGVMDDETLFPVGHVLAEMAARSGATVLAAASRRPERVQALPLRSGRTTHLLLGNLTRWRHPIVVEGLAGRVRRAPIGDPGPGEEATFELELGPHEGVRLVVEAS